MFESFYNYATNKEMFKKLIKLFFKFKISGKIIQNIFIIKFFKHPAKIFSMYGYDEHKQKHILNVEQNKKPNTPKKNHLIHDFTFSVFLLFCRKPKILKINNYFP
jgi:hypothetical protein